MMYVYFYAGIIVGPGSGLGGTSWFRKLADGYCCQVRWKFTVVICSYLTFHPLFLLWQN